MKVIGQHQAPAALFPEKNSGTHWMGGWVGPRASMEKKNTLPLPAFELRSIDPVA